MGMSSGAAVAVTLDKDLRSCPGWLWNPEKQGFPELICEVEADEWFQLQWLTGDGTDCIPGLHRMGPKTALKLLHDTRATQWSKMVQQVYRDTADDYCKWTEKGARFEGSRTEMLAQKSGWKDGQNEEFCMAQARCVRILRHGEWDQEAEKPILWSP